MITLKNITLRRGAKVLLDGAHAVIQPGERVSLVGRNGAGKSTLFALLSGALHEDAGELTMPPQWRVAQVAQNLPETDAGATDFVLTGDERLSQLQEELSKAEQAGDGIAIAHAHSDLADAGAYDARARAQALILGLGFGADQLERPVNSFSGGWRMRLQLARALMAPSDLLLLDEPTNHLDLDALVWLESWLARYPGTLIVISHDREFLDAVTGVTLHLENTRLTRYGGNYSAFETLRAQQLALQQAAYARQQQQIAHLRQFIDRFKAKATKARQAQSRVKALERMEQLAPVLAEADFSFEFQPPPSLPNPMLVLKDARLGYRDSQGHETAILDSVVRTVLAGQRIGILGANGQGKSTLVKTIAHVLQPLAGRVTEGRGLRIGYFAQQELDVLRPADSPLAHLQRLARETGQEHTEAGREQALRNFLGGFNFPGEMVTQPASQFSGGEKARLLLAMIVWQKPNLLLLDEPTNHLDLVTREALAVALASFEGAVLLVSHDRALLRAVCEDFWLVGGAQVRDFEGDLDDYQRYLLDEARRRREALAAQTSPPQIAPGSSPDHRATPSPQPALTPAEQRRQDARRRQQKAERLKPLRQAIAQIDQRLAQLTTERTALEQRLAQPALTPADIAGAGKQLKTTGEEIARLEEEWLDLSGQIEAMEQET